MSTNLKVPLDAGLRPLQPGAGIPARLVAAVESVKASGDAEIQNRFSKACARLMVHLREHIEVNRPLGTGVWCTRLFTRPTHVSAQRGCLRAASTFASPDIAEGDDVAVGRVMTHLGPHEVAAIYSCVLAEWFVVEGDRVAPGRPLVWLHPVAGAR